MKKFWVWGWCVASLAVAENPPLSQLQLSLPAQRAHSNLVRDGVLYLLNGVSVRPVTVSGSHASTGVVIHDTIDLDAADLPQGFLKALGAVQSAGEVYSAFKKEPFRSYYQNETRKRFHTGEPIPETLSEFEKRYPFQDGDGWSKSTLSTSDVKQALRNIYRAPPSAADMSVAQTVVVDSVGVESVRETEIIVKREGSDDFDFYVYSAQGQLVTVSEFTSSMGKPIVAPVPITCMACHYDYSNRQFVREPFVE